MFPVLVVFALPFLSVPNSTPWFSLQESLLQGFLPSPSHKFDTVQSQSASSPSHPSRFLIYERYQQEHENTGEEIHVLVDTLQHRLFVKQGDRILYAGIVSTGKGSILVDPQDSARVWTFDTPKGIFRIQSKLKNPVWIRPDWAFIEQGKPVPETTTERLMPGVLGPYALGFGDGYFIHGALYENLLGQDVTHGCIQLGRKDLEYVFQMVPLGAALIIL
jgi:lipoprotein-anchoring transpeptidase ErfK/SrfK